MPNRWEMPPVYLQSGDPENENVPQLHAGGTLGCRFTVIQPTRGTIGVEAVRSKRYQLVQTDSTMAVAPFPGAVAWWADKTRYLVTTLATNRNRVAGVFQNAITKGNYGCIQIGGPASVKRIDTPAAAVAIGAVVIPSSTNGKADILGVGTAPTHTVMGQVAGPPLSEDAPGATVVVDLDIPETT